MPPLSLRVVDHRAFGSKPVVATAVVTDLQRYTVEPKAARSVTQHQGLHLYSLVCSAKTPS